MSTLETVLLGGMLSVSCFCMGVRAGVTAERARITRQAQALHRAIQGLHKVAEQTRRIPYSDPFDAGLN